MHVKVGLPTLATIILAILKVAGVINVGWLVVAAPMLVSLAIGLGVLAVMIVAFVASIAAAT